MPEFRHQTFSFHAGEISPLAQGSTDQETFARGLQTCRNWITTPQGAVMNRPGTDHVGFDHLPFTPGVISFTASTLTNPVKITKTSHGLQDGDIVTIVTSTTADHELTGTISDIRIVDDDNFLLVGVNGTGHAASQAGTYLVSDASTRVRCIPFKFNTTDTYMLYFGEKWIMVAKNGELVTESAGGTYSTGDADYTSSGTPLVITQATPTDHGFWCDDDVFMGSMDNDLLAKDHGDKRYRVIPVFESSKSIFGTITNAGGLGKIQFVVNVHGYTTGDRILVSGTSGGGASEINDLCFAVDVIDPNLFTLIDRNGDFVQTVIPGSSTTGGTTEKIDPTNFALEGTGGDVSGAVTISGTKTFNRLFRLETPWSSSDLPNLDYAQTADIITFTCDGFRPRNISRTADDAWTIDTVDFKPSIQPPPDLAEGTTGSDQQVMVTTVSLSTGEESFAREDFVGTSSTNKVDWDDVEDAFEYNVYVRRASDQNPGIVDVVSVSRIELNTPDEVGNIAVRPPYYDNPFTEKTGEKSITSITQAQPSVVTTSTDHEFKIGDFVRIEGCDTQRESSNRNYEIQGIPADDEIELKFTDSLGYANSGSNGSIFKLDPTTATQPTAIARFQNRSAFAATQNNPQAVFLTGSGLLESFQRRIPQSDSDAISIEIQDVNLESIRWLIPMEDLIALTAGGAYALRDAKGFLTPTGTVPVRQFEGAISIAKPVKIGPAVIYGKQESSALYELVNVVSASGTTSSYRSANISTQAEHLFKGFTIEELAYAEDPVNVVWGIRNDGTLIGLTRYRELEIVGFHRHDTSGNFESVGTIPEGFTSASYFSIKRTVNGVTRRFFERLHIHEDEEIRDAHYVDNGKKYEEKFPAVPDFFSTSPLRINVGANHGFVVGDFVDIEHKIDGIEGTEDGFMDGDRFEVSAIGAEIIELDDLFGDPFDGSAVFDDVITTFNVYRCFKVAQFFDHLVGESVAILADGSVKEEQVVAVDGTLTFTDFHSRVTAGASIEAVLTTLSPDAPAGPFASIAGAAMKLNRAIVLVENTRGLLTGPTKESVSSHNFRSDEDFGDPTKPVSGLRYINTDSKWNRGVVFMIQRDPLPATVISIGLDLEVETKFGSRQ